MTKENNKVEVQEKSLSDVLGMNFKEDGTWEAKDIGNTPTYRKLNRKERRIQKATLKKLVKRK